MTSLTHEEFLLTYIPIVSDSEKPQTSAVRTYYVNRQQDNSLEFIPVKNEHEESIQFIKRAPQTSAPVGINGSPAEIGGSPAGIGGSPAGIGGSPAGISASSAGGDEGDDKIREETDPKRHTLDTFQRQKKVKLFGREWCDFWRIRELIGWTNGEYIQTRYRRDQLKTKREKLKPQIGAILMLMTERASKKKTSFQDVVEQVQEDYNQSLNELEELELKMQGLKEAIIVNRDEIMRFSGKKKDLSDLTIGLENRISKIVIENRKLDEDIKKILEDASRREKLLHIAQERRSLVCRREAELSQRVYDCDHTKALLSKQLAKFHRSKEQCQEDLKHFESTRTKAEKDLQNDIKTTAEKRQILEMRLRELVSKVNAKKRLVDIKNQPVRRVEKEIEEATKRNMRLKSDLSKMYAKEKNLLMQYKNGITTPQESEIQVDIKKHEAIIKDLKRQIKRCSSAPPLPAKDRKEKRIVQKLITKKKQLQFHLKSLKRKELRMTRKVSRLNDKLLRTYRDNKRNMEGQIALTPILKQCTEDSKPQGSARKNSVSFSDSADKSLIQTGFESIVRLFQNSFRANVPDIPYTYYASPNRSSTMEVICAPAPKPPRAPEKKKKPPMQREEYYIIPATLTRSRTAPSDSETKLRSIKTESSTFQLPCRTSSAVTNTTAGSTSDDPGPNKEVLLMRPRSDARSLLSRSTNR